MTYRFTIILKTGNCGWMGERCDMEKIITVLQNSYNLYGTTISQIIIEAEE